MFDYSFNYIYGILGYNNYSWYFRIWIVLIFPFAFPINVILDIVVLIIRTIIGIYQDI
jgi:hypothetical protein